MKSNQRIRKRTLLPTGTIIWLILGLYFCMASSSRAYIDPGTGSYAIQIVIGVFFGAAYALKSFGGQIIRRFKRQNPKDGQDN